MDEAKETVGIFLVVFLLVGGGFIGAVFFNKYVTCPNFGKMIERPYRFSIWTGCFVQDVKGQWVKRENYWNAPIK